MLALVSQPEGFAEKRVATKINNLMKCREASGNTPLTMVVAHGHVCFMAEKVCCLRDVSDDEAKLVPDTKEETTTHVKSWANVHIDAFHDRPLSEMPFDDVKCMPPVNAPRCPEHTRLAPITSSASPCLALYTNPVAPMGPSHTLGLEVFASKLTGVESLSPTALPCTDSNAGPSLVGARHF